MRDEALARAIVDRVAGAWRDKEMRRRVGCQNGSASPLTPLKNEKGPGRVQPSQGSSVVWHGTNDKAVRTATMPGEVY
jgi:hypothetical protein